MHSVCVHVCISQDMYNLMNSLHEVLESSVIRPPHHADTTPLKIRLVLTPASPDRTPKRGKYFLKWLKGKKKTLHLCCVGEIAVLMKLAEKKQSVDGRQGRRLYCEDENVERRNHYLNLAGIENYSSKFDNTGTDTGRETEFLQSGIKKLILPPSFSRNTLSGAQSGCSLCSSAPPCGKLGETQMYSKASQKSHHLFVPRKWGDVGGKGQKQRRGKCLQMSWQTCCLLVSPSPPLSGCSTAHSQQEASLQGTGRRQAPRACTGRRYGDILSSSPET